MRIAIVDDMEMDRRELLELLEKYFTGLHALAEYDCFQSGEEFLAAFAPGRWQIAFLDIYMDGEDGIAVARRLREQDKACRLVFLTISSDHAVVSYGVRASYYLTKPTSYALLCDALDACTAGLLADSKYLAAQAGRLPVKVLLRELLYVDCQNKAPVLHIAAGTLVVSDTFNRVAQQLLADERFYMSCRGVVVNLDWVSRMPGDGFLLKNGELVPVRQRGKKKAKEAFLARSMRDLRRDPPAKAGGRA